MALILILIAAVLVRIPFLLQAGNLFDFDEATFALMAKRILEGELVFYISGHSYSGAFVSYVMAPFIAVLGTTALTVKLTSLTLFLGFLTVNYFLFKRLANRTVAIFTSLFLILMPMDMFDISMRVWGGHLELWVFQAAALLLLWKYFDGPSSFFPTRLLFCLGLIIGAALWISEFFVLFLIPFLLFFFLRFRDPGEDSIFKWIVNFFLLRYFRLPKLLRYALIGLNCFLLFVLLIHISSIFLLHNFGIPDKFFKIFGANPAFQIKMMKKLMLVFGIEVLVIYFLHNRPFSKLLMIKNLGAVVAGVVTGYLPAIIFNLAGGEGLRIFQKSGFLASGEIPNRFRSIFFQKIPNFILGIGDNYSWKNDQFLVWGSWLFGAIIIAALAGTAFYFRNDLKALIQPNKGGKPSYVWIYFFVGIFTLLANLFSTLEAARYLAPLYLAIAAILGYFFGQVLWNKQKAISLILCLAALSCLGYSVYRFYEFIPKTISSTRYEILDYLRSQNVRGGFAGRNISHNLTFLANEELVFSTYLNPPERYLPHQKYTVALNKRAFVFEPGEAAYNVFSNDAAQQALVKSTQTIGETKVIIVGEAEPKEDPAYKMQPHKFPLHFYLNE